MKHKHFNIDEIKRAINKSVLCWLATFSKDNIPNVSPKEVFTYFEDDQIIIANIASPQSVSNIQENNQVCVSFIDILIQKGFQIKGQAEIIDAVHPDYSGMESTLLKITGGKYPFKTITSIKIEKVKPIIAPSYFLFPEITEKEQIENAKKTYGLN